MEVGLKILITDEDSDNDSHLLSARPFFSLGVHTERQTDTREAERSSKLWVKKNKLNFLKLENKAKVLNSCS